MDSSAEVIKFCEMNNKDLDEVLEIENSSFSTPWSRKIFEQELMYNKLAYYIVAFKDDKLVGYAGMWLMFNIAHITNIAVSPGCRRQKIGAKLLEELIKRAIIFKASKISLEVRVSNKPAINLYTSFGFKKQKLHKEYYSDNEDALIMKLDNIFEIDTNFDNYAGI